MTISVRSDDTGRRGGEEFLPSRTCRYNAELGQTAGAGEETGSLGIQACPEERGGEGGGAYPM